MWLMVVCADIVRVVVVWFIWLFDSASSVALSFDTVMSLCVCGALIDGVDGLHWLSIVSVVVIQSCKVSATVRHQGLVECAVEDSYTRMCTIHKRA